MFYFFHFFLSISYNNTDVTEYIVLQTQSTPPPLVAATVMKKSGGGNAAGSAYKVEQPALQCCHFGEFLLFTFFFAAQQ